MQSVVIVGGGSAGWMTAAYLQRAIPGLKISLIESAHIRTVGVGEATFSTFKLFADFLGLREHDFMPHCSASYKLAIRFVNWQNKPGHFYHPFERFPSASGYNAGEWWLKLGRGEPFDYACFTAPWLCDANRSPRFMDGTVFDGAVHEFYDDQRSPPNSMIARHEVQYPYGYHFNASELAEFLASWAVSRGVERVVDDVTEVCQAEDGSIEAVRTKEHGLIRGDLFIDCSGFRSLLLQQTLEEPFVSFSSSLLNDRAVAIQVPRDIERDGIKPYTTAHALSSGWAWNIPLYGRDGTGYVYCSAFKDESQAEAEFRELLGDPAKDCSALHIKMRIGRARRSWVKNCVAIGLSGGFVEPLESTGIFFIQHAIEELVRYFPSPAGIDPLMVDSYNKVIRECVDGVAEFLALHYRGSDRDDTEYWRAVRRLNEPEDLAERLRLWKGHLPCARTIYPAFHGFEAYSWACMLVGLGSAPASHRGVLDRIDHAPAKAMFEQVRSRASGLVATLPSAYDYLTQMRQAS